MSSPLSRVLLSVGRAALPVTMAALLLAASPALTSSSAARAQQVWEGSASAAAGGALGSERTFFYAKLSVPLRVGGPWAIGPTAAVFSELNPESDPGNAAENATDDRVAIGLEGRYRFTDGEPVLAYAGARGLYSFSEGDGSGPYGGVLAGVQYTLVRRVAVGLEAQALRGPEEFLAVPLAVFTLRF